MSNIKGDDLNEEELKNEITEILKTSGLQISSKQVLQKVEQNLGIQLSEKKTKTIIYKMIMDIIVNTMPEEKEKEELYESSEEDSAEEVEVKKCVEKFQINIDVAQLDPEEIMVTIADHHVIVNGKHKDGHEGNIFTKVYALPSGVDEDLVISKLSSDSVLSIIAPINIPEACVKIVPIYPTGPVRTILKTSGLQVTSKVVLQQLEKKLGVDLSEKKKQIYRMVMDIVNSMSSEEEDLDESSEEEVKVKKESKTKSPQKRKSEEAEEESEEEDTSDEVKVKKESPKPKKKAKRKKRGSDEEDNSNDGDWVAKKKKGGGGRGNGYTKPYKLSPALAELMGETELPRHEVVKRIWAIIKEKQLYDPKNRQFAICDKALYKVIGIQRFRTFGMMKYLKNHFIE